MGCGASTQVQDDRDASERDMTKTPGGGPLRSSNREAADPTVPSHNYTAAWSEDDGLSSRRASLVTDTASPAGQRRRSSVHSQASYHPSLSRRRSTNVGSDTSSDASDHGTRSPKEYASGHYGELRLAQPPRRRSLPGIVPPLSNNRKTVSHDPNSPIIKQMYSFGDDAPQDGDTVECFTPEQSMKDLTTPPPS